MFCFDQQLSPPRSTDGSCHDPSTPCVLIKKQTSSPSRSVTNRLNALAQRKKIHAVSCPTFSMETSASDGARLGCNENPHAVSLRSSVLLHHGSPPKSRASRTLGSSPHISPLLSSSLPQCRRLVLVVRISSSASPGSLPPSLPLPQLPELGSQGLLDPGTGCSPLLDVYMYCTYT